MNTGQDWMQDGERVSALVDGSLGDADMAQTLALLQGSQQARAAWADYHRVGEALRGEWAQRGADDAEFVARLRLRLAQAASPQLQPKPQPIAAQPATPAARAPSSANDAHWKRVVGLASVALAGVVAWQGLQRIPATPDGAGAQLAQTAARPAGAALVLAPLEQEPIFAATQPVMIRDARLDAVLAASRQSGGQARLPASGFVQNAAFAEPRR